MANISFYAKPTQTDEKLIISAFDQLEELPKEKWSKGRNARWIASVERLPLGLVKIQSDVGEFDIVRIRGNMVLGDEKNAKVYICAVQDHVPFDWYGRVRKTLGDATSRFAKERCNLLFLEVADLANIDQAVEFTRICEAIEDFLYRDTRRVSAVVLTATGIVPSEGPGRFKSSGAAWTFLNPNPYVPVPHDFSVPSFNHPRVSVSGTSSRS